MTERIIGCDFGVPASAGAQAKKIILIEAIRLGDHHYRIVLEGRNERLVRERTSSKDWQKRRRGWTVPELARSLASDATVTVAAFDFPFSIPVALLNDPEFAGKMGQAPFQTRQRWADYVSRNLRLEFSSATASGKLLDLKRFRAWQDTRFWLRRRTDQATNASPPLKHHYQNLFAMTLAGVAMLEQLRDAGVHLALAAAEMTHGRRTAFETYPALVSRRSGFTASYKKQPRESLEAAEQLLRRLGIRLEFSPSVREFCLNYSTAGANGSPPDPDGADAFLCLVSAIAFREGKASAATANAAPEILIEEGSILAPQGSMTGNCTD